MVALADGDGRYLLTLIETLFNIGTAKPLTTQELGRVLQKRSPAYDKDREEHYNLISALHKFDPRLRPGCRALYWLARMLGRWGRSAVRGSAGLYEPPRKTSVKQTRCR